MSVIVVNASPSGVGNVPGPYGNVGWAPISGSVTAQGIPNAAGTAWAIWRVITSAAAVSPGAPFNGVMIQGPLSFTGAAADKRSALLYLGLRKDPNFGSEAGTFIDTYIGDGANHAISVLLTDTSMTGADIIAGNCYVGAAVRTGDIPPTTAVGAFFFGALKWQFSYGADIPGGGGTQIVTELINPQPNWSPGKYNTQAFDSLRCNILQTPYDQYVGFSWVLPTGLTFAVNGSNNLQHNRGVLGYPADPMGSDTGVINIAPGTPAGIYIIVLYISAASYNTQISTQLVIRPRNTGFFTEV